MAYDEARKQAVAFGAGQVIGYRAPYRMTTVLYDSPHDADGVGGGPLARMMHWLAYDPIHARFIVTGGAFQTPDALEGMRPGNDVWAWDPPTSEWLQLAMAATERTNFEPPYAPED
jgi:hypothetical protein